MKKCPQCAEKVKSGAKVCRFCGHSFPEKPKPPPQTAGEAVATAGCSLLLLLGFFALLSRACTRDTNAPAPQADAFDIQVAAEAQLKQTLIDPDSAEFRGRFVSRLDNGGMALCGEVNSKNRFGGYTGYHRFIAGPTAAQPSMVEGEVMGLGKELDRKVFPTAWATLCSNPIQYIDH